MLNDQERRSKLLKDAEVQSILYLRLVEGFTNWLRVLNFEHTSPRDMPKMLLEFLLFLEGRWIKRTKMTPIGLSKKVPFAS